MNAYLRALGILAAGSGLDPRKLSSLRNIPRFLSERKKFINKGGKIDRYTPIVFDYDTVAGTLSGQYFHQDLLVASFVNARAPLRHIDIGSRIDGFVAHVASFRRIEVFDIRPMPASKHENMKFIQVDLMDPDARIIGSADSVSCLHAIEHFGLGRYGDEIDPNGHKKGFANICRLVAPAGILYMGVPISAANEVQFNANRLFHPADILTWTQEIQDFDLIRFDYIDDNGQLQLDTSIDNCSVRRDGCGIYTFKRKSLDRATPKILPE